MHFKGDYDERYLAKKHVQNILRILQRILTVRSQHFKVYRVPQKKLRAYCTTKEDAKAGRNNRPDDKFLTGQTSTGAFDFDQIGPRRPTLAKSM